MSSAPPVGSQSGHDWLVVGTVNPPSPEVESALKPNKSLQDWFAALTALLGKFEDRSANFFRTARIVGGGAVFALLNKVRDQSFQNSRRRPRPASASNWQSSSRRLALAACKEVRLAAGTSDCGRVSFSYHPPPGISNLLHCYGAV